MAELKSSNAESKPAAPKAKPKSATYMNNGKSAISLSRSKKLQVGESVKMLIAEAKLFNGLLDRV